MPRKGITAYDLLISCPGDVTVYLEIINKSVDNFNRYIGKVNNIEIVTKHWSTDSYPQSGDKPQKLLNKQFVQDCDAAVAIFWTRFGTPTDKFGSGTEEEIEEMLIAGKQVFMYFIDEPVNLSQVDLEQYKKVLEFRKSYKDKGIYVVTKNKDEFEREFINHLSLYFIPLITGISNGDPNDKSPKLLLRGISDNTTDVATLCNMNLKACSLVEDKKERIIQIIHNLNNNNILQARIVEIENLNEPKELSGNKIKSNLNLYKTRGNSVLPEILVNVDFDVEKISKISNFLENENIKISQGFWNVGNLKERAATFVLPFSNGLRFEGTDNEKKRYDMLNELYWEVVEFNEFTDYFSYIDSFSFLKMFIENVGNSFDEDIDVKIFIKKGFVLKKEFLKYPGINIIDKLLKIRFIDFIFSIPENEYVESYGYYPIEEPFYKDILPINHSLSEEYEIGKTKFYDSLEQIYCYKLFENDEDDIFMFHMDYLKHNKAMMFPAALIFQDTPEIIKYEITSKYNGDVVKGEIKIDSNE